jgi:hypothetical protein
MLPVHIGRIGRDNAAASGLQRLHPAGEAFHRLLALRAIAKLAIVGCANFNRMRGFNRFQASRGKLGLVVEQAHGRPASAWHNVRADPVEVGTARPHHAVCYLWRNVPRQRCRRTGYKPGTDHVSRNLEHKRISGDGTCFAITPLPALLKSQPHNAGCISPLQGLKPASVNLVL